MVCKTRIGADTDCHSGYTDLCQLCVEIIVDDFRAVWPKLSPDAKAINARHMRLDSYKE